MIRKPGRLGQIPCGGVTMYVAHCPPRIGGDEEEGADTATAAITRPHLEVRQVADVEEMLSLDIRLGRPTEGARAVDKPLLLVCTHGKRDRCCAVKGRPIAQALNNVHPDVVWETSHSKGHRVAPALVLLPWNYSYGRLSAVETNQMLHDASSGVLHSGGCRGRGVWDARGQVAELAARGNRGVAPRRGGGGGRPRRRRRARGRRASPVLRRLRSAGRCAGADAAAVVEFDDGRAFGVAQKMVTEASSPPAATPGPKKGWRARRRGL